MDTLFKPFITTLIGSMPRSPQLLAAKEDCHDNNICGEYNQLVHEESQSIMDLFEGVGIDVPVSGEITRDNYMSYVAEHVDGIQLYSTDDIKELMDDEEAYSKSLEEMDAADNSMNSPVCVGKIDTTAALNLEELDRLEEMAYAPYKITIPSPYLLTRSLWVEGVSDQVYDTRRELGKDIVELLKNEIKNLVARGVKIIQIDEPILSEVVFQRSEAETSFFWGTLSAKVKVDKELIFAQTLIQPVLDEINQHEGVISAMHVCRGNFTKDENVLLVGAYNHLAKFFDKLKVDMLALEFSTPRAGEISQLFYNNFLDEKIILGLGVINPRSDEVETVEEIMKLAEEALEFLPPERIWLNPDCGFATFAKRPLNPYPVIEAKLANMVEAAKLLRKKHCS